VRRRLHPAFSLRPLSPKPRYHRFSRTRPIGNRRRSLATTSRRSRHPRRSCRSRWRRRRPAARRGDAFDPSQNPSAPGAPRALGGGQLPIVNEAPVGAPGGRGPGEPLDLGATSPRDPGGAPPPRGPASAGLTTLPPSATSKDEFDLGIGYMQRKDYALAEETMKSFAQKYPSDPLIADSQYWLGESYFQRQQYRDAADAFLGVSTKFDKSAKAPDSLLRLGQSLAALKEKEAACAVFGEVTRKYPRASAGVKAAVDREQKRVKC